MRFILSSLIFLVPLGLFSQNEDTKDWELSGYIKNLQGFFFFNTPIQDRFLQDNLIHNRLNFIWYANENLTLRADLRSRIFFGDFVEQQPNYAQTVDNVNNDYFDLSLVLLDSRSFVAHTMLDRIYLEYIKGDWEIRLGRQRVNWGVTTVWNPNDVFNAFAFTDFDYEERPGSDALRIKRYTGFASSIELAAKLADRIDEAVIAGMWKFNEWNYDFQLLGGWVQQQWAIGGGWAGNIKEAGFKGEWTVFLPASDQQKTSFAASLGLDYIFENEFYLNLGYLYNSHGSTQSSITNLFDFELSAQNLYPYRHALFLQGNYPITPLLNTGLAVIYSPLSIHPLFLNPNFAVSIATNWDLDLIGQVVFNEEEQYKSPLQAAFLRLKYSF